MLAFILFIVFRRAKLKIKTSIEQVTFEYTKNFEGKVMGFYDMTTLYLEV